MTEGDAYFAGLLFADGSFRTKPSGNLEAQLVLVDKDTVEQFRSYLGSERPIREKETPEGRQRQYAFCSTGHSKVHKIGHAWGIAEKNRVPHKLVGSRHFLRGFTDGDGCLYIRERNGRKSFLFQLTNQSRNLLQQLKDEYSAFENVSIRQSSGAFVLSAESKSAAKLAKTIYADTTYAMPRKKQTAHKYDL